MITDNELMEPQFTIEFNRQKRSVDLSNPDDGKHLNVLSLFSGCGGMDLGFEGNFKVPTALINKKTSSDFIEEEVNESLTLLKKTRFKTVFANDILPDAKNAWINHFFKRGDFECVDKFRSESIVDLVKLHNSQEKVFPEKVDIVTGGFPCQDFSIAGKRKGFDSHKNHQGHLKNINEASEETRGKLYMWMKRVVEITQPKMFIAENVKGLVNLSNVKEIIQKDFSSINGNGYFVFDPQVLHAANFGIPQSRERVIFIGVKKSALKPGILKKLQKKVLDNELSPYPIPTHSNKDEISDLAPFTKLSDIFSLLEEPEQSDDLSQKHYSKAKFMGAHCQGQTEVKLNGIAPTIRSEHHGNIEFRRLSQEKGGKHIAELENGLIERRLTPRECGLIQTFPLDYEFVIGHKHKKRGSFLVSPSQAYKIIGNAVPPLLAYHISRRIEKIWDLYF
ncbi:DNA cytosine methyltransferase [Mucilaginibacter pocheonensis]|uniref:Cytosine-specific methyltransferase n=1 Tax=Mucilaginibacter pocheonensis TaxID=398050 RepID=A0ABU1T982_9SPHI|nr:DNA (cytosine-5-)-methyltransferase [Mucilaginibacter pocheonensis]MDR6941939.1 DNA (cytosine-5)-methyltransferase 1 [Mucilaginibacter pocheonensis]